jgi:hypothetical protein
MSSLNIGLGTSFALFSYTTLQETLMPYIYILVFNTVLSGVQFSRRGQHGVLSWHLTRDYETQRSFESTVFIPILFTGPTVSGKCW